MLLVAGCSRPPGENSRWHTDRIEYYVNRGASPLSEEAIRYAFDNWDEATHFTFTCAGRHRAGLKKDGKNTVSFLTRWPEDIPFGQTAWCRCWYNRKGDIVECDIILNQELARFTTLETRTPDAYYIEGVMAHEIGHMIGLGHSTSPASVMNPASSTDISWFRGNIDQETLDNYRRLYR